MIAGAGLVRAGKLTGPEHLMRPHVRISALLVPVPRPAID